MNKLFTKIAGLSLGLAMAIGVGVAVGSKSQEAKSVSAAAGDTFSLASSIAANDEITFVGINGSNYYSSAAQASNNRSGVAVTYSSSKITAVATTSIFKVEADADNDGYWNFKDTSTNQYLYNASGSKSYLRSGSTVNADTYRWSVSISNGVATISSKSTTRPNIRFNYNNGSPLFNCYASGQSDVYIYKKDAAKTLSSISVSDSHRSFTVGDTFVKETVTAHYSDSSSATVTDTASFTGYNMSSAGNQTVTVSYTESGVTKTVTYSITVNAPSKTLSFIAVTTAPTKTTYEAGETFDSTGMVVTATYSDASTDTVTSSCTFSPSGALSTSDDEITVSYTYAGTTRTATQAITVTQSSTITLDPTVTTSFPYQGITLTTTNGVFDNGTDYRIYKGATLTISSSVGDIATITLTYDGSYDGGGWDTSYSPNASSWTSPAATSGSSGRQARITMIVIKLASSDPVSTLAITGSMTKTTYTQYEAWDPTGFTVNAYYESAPSTPVNVTNEESLEWSYNPATTADTSTESVIVTASFGGKTASSSAQSVTISAASYTNTTNLTPGNYYIKYVDGGTSHYITSVSGGTGATQTSNLNALVFTFALVGNDTWQITNGSNYLGIGSSSTSLSLDSTTVTCSIDWDDESSGTRTIGGGSDGRYLAWYSNNNEFRTYKNGTLAVTLETAKTVSGFSVYSTGANKNVIKDSVFDAAAAATAGFQARLNYTDSTYDDVTSLATWDLNTGTLGTATLTVTYLTYDSVVINDMNIINATIVSLTINASSAKTTGYWTGDSLVTSGLVITGLDSSSNEYPISIENCTFSPTTLSTAGSQTITVTYTNEDTSTATGTYTVTVTAYAYQLASSINGGDRIIIAATDAHKYYLTAGTGTASSYVDKPGTEYYLDVVAGVNDGTVAFKDSSGKYLNGATAKALSLSDDITKATSWTVEFSEYVPTITNVSSTDNVLKFNTGSPVFRVYANANAPFINIYKLIGTSGQAAAETWATSFNTDVVNGVCKPNGANFNTVMPTAWSAKATTYAALSNEAKAYIASKSANASGDTVEKALYEYNHIYSTYGSSLSLINYIGRIEPIKVSSSSINLNQLQASAKSAGTTIAIIAISAVSLAAIGGYFLFRKKKEN